MFLSDLGVTPLNTEKALVDYAWPIGTRLSASPTVPVVSAGRDIIEVGTPRLVANLWTILSLKDRTFGLGFRSNPLLKLGF